MRRPEKGRSLARWIIAFAIAEAIVLAYFVYRVLTSRH